MHRSMGLSCSVFGIMRAPFLDRRRFPLARPNSIGLSVWRPIYDGGMSTHDGKDERTGPWSSDEWKDLAEQASTLRLSEEAFDSLLKTLDEPVPRSTRDLLNEDPIWT